MSQRSGMSPELSLRAPGADEAHPDGAEPDLVARMHGRYLRDPRAVEIRPVAGCQVAELPAALRAC